MHNIKHSQGVLYVISEHLLLLLLEIWSGENKLRILSLEKSNKQISQSLKLKQKSDYLEDEYKVNMILSRRIEEEIFIKHAYIQSWDLQYK